MNLNAPISKTRPSRGGQRMPTNRWLAICGLQLVLAVGSMSADEVGFRAYLDEIVFASPKEKAEARRRQRTRRLKWARIEIAKSTRRIQKNPPSGTEYLTRAHAFLMAGDTTRARTDLLRALQLADNDPSVLAAAAWKLATSPRDSYRDGTLALELAQKACRLTAYKEVGYFEVLAASYAEVGRFQSAVWWQQKVADRCPSNSCSRCEMHLAMFQDRTTLAEYAKLHDVVWFPQDAVR